MTPEISWTHPVVVSELPDEGAEFRISPDAAARAQLAEFAGVVALKELTAVFQVKPTAGGGASVEGSLDAVVTQECVVTLEPFDNKVSEAISLRFVPEGTEIAEPDPEDDDFDSELPDQLTNGAVDLAAVTAEFLALGVDPYPRKPGAVFKATESGDKPSAFAALEQLKRGKGGEKG